jgi:ABC-type transporter Mla MlaB component
MRLNTLPNVILFEGVLDENTSLSELEASFLKMKSTSGGQPIALDFSKVLRANSSGILVWLRFLNKANYQFKYLNAPVWLVGQFNMISGHFRGGGFVESFQAPFFAPRTQASKNLTLVVGKDLPLQKDYSNFKIPNRAIDGENFEIDFDPDQYFHFLSENYEAFKTVVA